MKTLEKILDEIADLQQQREQITERLEYQLKYYDIHCLHCELANVDMSCGGRHWPRCFRPNEEWKRKYEEGKK